MKKKINIIYTGCGMLKSFILVFMIITGIHQLLNAQQIGEGLEPVIFNFNVPLLSGGYNGCTVYGITGGVPDNDHQWQHLFTIRHPNTNNNHQLQIGSSFAQNDRLFFRKIAVSDVSEGNSSWYELATRGNNTFNGNQIINGEIIWPIMQKNFNAAPREGISPMSFKIWDNYQGSGSPTSWGTLLEIYGRDSHLVSQLYFDGDWGNSKIRYRSAFYSQTQWNDWKVLLDSKNDVESSGNFHVSGSGDHYFSAGRVGIGTTAPKNLLDVNGTIHAREVKVDLTGWSDFVFAPSYKLKPLSEIELYIKANGKLPEIPSASEVEQNGVNVGDMQVKLLQKVEELTLYTIELEKTDVLLRQKIAEQGESINDQEKENSELKQEIQAIKDLLSNSHQLTNK